MAIPGVLIQGSPYPVKETMDRLQTAIAHHGGTTYARINQQEEARAAGQDLLPLEFLLFGNPQAGGPIMAANPVAALDLPLKIIAWEDVKRQVWVAFNDAAYIENRYSLAPATAAPLDLTPMIAKALATEGLLRS